jgi:lysophospholipase L1-like esterase
VRRYRPILAVAVAIPLVVVLVAARRSAGTSGRVPLPTSMAAAGDSITAGFDADWGHLLRADPASSWSTGTNPAVDSQYRRIVGANPAMAGQSVNEARTGARMADLDGQLQRAAARHVQYLTVLVGADDLCTSSPATMTPSGTFRAEFAKALDDFFAADRAARVFVSSIPDIYRLWTTLHGNLQAEARWSLAGICRSMLSLTNTSADRQRVAAQEQADNASLASVCAAHANCRWDRYATFRAPLSAADISPVDEFHPNPAGQRALAAVTWGAGYGPAVR